MAELRWYLMIDFSYYVGIAGLILITLAWLSSIKNKPPASLSGLYSLGSLLLAIYAVSKKDPVFAILNFFAVSISGYQFLSTLYEKKHFVQKNKA